MQLLPTGRLINHTAQCFNPTILKGARITYLAADAAAASGTITCRNITSTTIPFTVGTYILIGEFGEETSEIVRVHTITTPVVATGVVTLNANTTRPHTIDDPVYALPYNQVQFFRGDTTAIAWRGTWTVATAYIVGDTVIDTDDNNYYICISAHTAAAGNRPPNATFWRDALSNGVDIEADNEYTVFNDVTNTTGQLFFRFRESTAATIFYSAFSEAIPYTGETRRTISRLWDSVLSTRHVKRTKEIEDYLLDQTNNFIDEVEGLRIWDFEVTAESTVALATGTERYAMPTDIKRPNNRSSLESVYVRDSEPMSGYTWDEYRNDQVGRRRTTLTAAVITGDPTISVTSTADFETSGSINIEGDDIAYTGVTATTFTGVTGIVAAGHANGATVWQGATFGEPTKFTVWNGEMYVEPIPNTTISGRLLHRWFYRELPKIDSPNDVLTLRFPYLLELYLEWKVEKWKGNSKGEVQSLKEEFEGKLLRHANKEKLHQRKRLVPISLTRTGEIVTTK